MNLTIMVLINFALNVLEPFRIVCDCKGYFVPLSVLKEIRDRKEGFVFVFCCCCFVLFFVVFWGEGKVKKEEKIR